MRCAILVVTMVTISNACTAPPAANTRSPADSSRGIVSITGTSFQKTIVLRSSEGAITLTPSPSDSLALSRLGGIEVMVKGARTSTGLRVDRFTVISVEGRPVIDGVFRTVNGQFYLEHDGKRTLIGNPPTVLRSMAGARVWIGGPLATGPNTFGIITPATPE